jgi:hypothetical protein
MAQLPTVPRKVLAMYYYENMRLADIAARLELTELNQGTRDTTDQSEQVAQPFRSAEGTGVGG